MYQTAELLISLPPRHCRLVPEAPGFKSQQLSMDTGSWNNSVPYPVGPSSPALHDGMCLPPPIFKDSFLQSSHLFWASIRDNLWWLCPPNLRTNTFIRLGQVSLPNPQGSRSPACFNCAWAGVWDRLWQNGWLGLVRQRVDK